MPRRKKGTVKKVTAKKDERFISEKPEVAVDRVRFELMKRVYVAKDPESTPATWLHHPDCKDEGGKDAQEKCEALGCGAFAGLEVGSKIDQGWWNSVPGDR